MARRITALMLALVLGLSVLGITAFAEADTVRIAGTIEGLGTVTVGGREYGSEFTYQAVVGQTVTLTAEAGENFEFLFWVNQETERIVSRDTTYTFRAASYAKLQAVFDLLESVTASESVPYHTVIYLTEGDNIRYFGTPDVGDEEYFADVPQNGLLASGKIFKYWDHTPQQVAAESGRVYVRPVYDIDESVFYKIRTYVGDSMQETEANFGQTVEVVAPATYEGKPFSYWKAVYEDENIPDQITSFYASYKFVVTMDATFVAYYGEEVTEGIATRIAGDRPNFEGATITLYAEHSVKQGYTVLQHGVIITSDETIGNFEDRFVIDPSPDSPIIKATANNTLLVGTYSVRKSKWYMTNSQGGYYYPKLFVRSYVIATDPSGVTHTVYSRPIYCADYHERLFEANDFDDPWG